MTRAEVEELVNNVLVEEFEKSEDELKAEASLFDDSELDSLDGIDLIVALEKAVKAKTGKETKINEEKAKSLKTVGDIYNVIEELN
jgi:acyl carrier protein